MKTIFDILRGVVIGLANIIPGVSGGTMMVSMGIYDTIIGCINSLFKDFKRCVKMLWPYALGMVLGILGLAKLITFLLGSYPLPTNMAFIGLILGGLPMILKKMKGEKKGAPGAIAFVLAFALVVGLKIVDGDNSTDASITLGLGQMIILFMMGVIAAATMVIPGVSGSMMLMLLGYYNPVVGSVSGLVDALLSGNMSAVLRCCGFFGYVFHDASSPFVTQRLPQVRPQSYSSDPTIFGFSFWAFIDLLPFQPAQQFIPPHQQPVADIKRRKSCIMEYAVGGCA